MHCNKLAFLFDHLVGDRKHARRNGQAEGPGSLEVDHQLELDRGLDWKLVRFRALEDAIDIRRRAPKIIDQVISVGQQAADCSFRVSLDDFVGEQQERIRDIETHRLGSLEVHDQFGELEGQLTRLRTLENFIYQSGRLAVHVRQTIAV